MSAARASLSHCLYLSLRLSLSMSVCLSLSLCLSVSVSVAVAVAVFLTHGKEGWSERSKPVGSRSLEILSTYTHREERT